MMTRSAAELIDTAPLRACVVARDIQAFDRLSQDLDAEMPDAWATLTLDEAPGFLANPAAVELELVAIAVNASDEEELPLFAEAVRLARQFGHKVLLVADGLGPTALHQLLAQGADGFVPYPIPPGALAAAIDRIATPPASAPQYDRRLSDPDRSGIVLPVHGLAGGVGATTFAVNLAWELATVAKDAPRVCLLDLDLQFGSVSTYLDLPRREAVFELISQTGTMDREGFLQALVPYGEKLSVLTAPSEIVPLDLVSPEDVARLVAMARSTFDYVVIDMPKPFQMWTEKVLQAAHVYFALIELDLRSAQNVLRTTRALKAEDLPVERLRFVLNRAPTGFGGKGRIARLTESLDLSLEVRLSDGGRAVGESCDHGQPLARSARRNPFRREIAKLAAQIHALNTAEAAKA